MRVRPAFRQSPAPIRGWVAALAVAMLCGSLPSWAQTAPGALPSTAAAEAPVIAAPDNPGRLAPGPLRRESSEAMGFNSFASSEAAVPPMDNFAPEAMPVVVELFTSQGCSSCPATDAMLARLSGEPGVLPLSFHVDYWDYLGWTDSFARPEFSQRQEAYARASGERALYTPQLIVDGRDTAVAPGPAQLMGLIDSSRIAPAMVSVQRDSVDGGERIELMPLSDLGGPVDVLLIRYVPRRDVQMSAGENRGRSVTYTNVVLALDRLARWDGRQPLRMTVRPEENAGDQYPTDTRHVLIVQRDLTGDAMPGPILAAIRLD